MLRKIIFLTLLGEILVFATILSMLFPDTGLQFIFPIHSIGFAIIIYLMIERNKKEYDIFIHYLYKSKICFCFNCLIKHNEIAIDDENIQTNKAMEQTIDTKDNSIKLEHTSYDNPSEITKTEM